jgi:hypothetical protein
VRVSLRDSLAQAGCPSQAQAAIGEPEAAPAGGSFGGCCGA